MTDPTLAPLNASVLCAASRERVSASREPRAVHIHLHTASVMANTGDKTVQSAGVRVSAFFSHKKIIA